MMKYLQKLGKALMLPVAALPVAGILRTLEVLLAKKRPGVSCLFFFRIGETAG